MTTPTADDSLGGSHLTRVLRWSAGLPVVLMLLGLASVSVIAYSLDNQREQLSRRLSAEHKNIEPVTSIRRDARKTYVALLERWLVPLEDRPKLDNELRSQAAVLVRSSRGFLEGVALTAAEHRHRAELASKLTAWAAFLDRVLGTAAGPQMRPEARERLDEIDGHCSAILAANVDGADQDDAAREAVKQKSSLSHLAIVVLLALLLVYVVVLYLQKMATRKVAEAHLQQRLQEEQSRVLEVSHRQLSQSMSQLSVTKQELEKRVRELATAHAQLVQVEKLQAVGQLAAGIAHEINTPMQYVGDGVHFLKEAFNGYRRLVSLCRRAVEVVEKTGGQAALVSEIRETEEDIDLSYLEANVPGSFDSCQDGIFRVSTIVRAMKEFAHPDQKEKAPADLNQALQTTLAIARNEYKYVAEVTTEFGDLPLVLCHVSDLNQVFLNLIVNAAHAIGDVVGKGGGSKGNIRITTSSAGDMVRVDIADTGSGIPEAIRHRIFEPFFTTKEVGKGTGQGLAIVRDIVVSKHRGSLTFESEVGKGTTFTIRLPIDGEWSAPSTAVGQAKEKQSGT